MKNSSKISIDGHSLSISEVVEVARNNKKVGLSSKAKLAIEKSRAWVEKSVAEGKVMYGISTGFGAFKNIVINKMFQAPLPNQTYFLFH